MRKTIIACAIGLMAIGSAAPAFAQDVIVGPSYDNDNGYRYHHHRDRPGVIISDQGIALGNVRDRDRYGDRGRCVTRTITRMNEDGDRVTKTIRRCD